MVFQAEGKYMIHRRPTNELPSLFPFQLNHGAWIFGKYYHSVYWWEYRRGYACSSADEATPFRVYEGSQSNRTRDIILIIPGLECQIKEDIGHCCSWSETFKVIEVMGKNRRDWPKEATRNIWAFLNSGKTKKKKIAASMWSMWGEERTVYCLYAKNPELEKKRKKEWSDCDTSRELLVTCVVQPLSVCPECLFLNARYRPIYNSHIVPQSR